MGCQCFKENSDGLRDESNLKASQEYSQQRLHLNAGQTQIDVQNGNLSDNEAQLLVSAIDDRGRAIGNPLFKKFQLQNEFDQNQLHQGDVVTIQMKQDRTALFLVLPIWRGGHHQEQSIFEQSVKKLMQFVTNQMPKSIAMDEIGVKKFGFPRQLVIEILVKEFSQFFSGHSSTGLQSIQFMSTEMCTVNMFEVEIKKYIKQGQQPPIRKSLEQEEFENSKIKTTKYNELEQPLLK